MENEFENQQTLSCLKISATALFTYELQNWDDEDWRRLDDDHNISIPDLSNKIAPFEEDLFLNTLTLSEENIGEMFGCNNSTYFQGSYYNSHIPFGPPNDPLQSMMLTAYFPCLDNDAFTEMDVRSAQIWLLRCKFVPDHPPSALLSSILEDTIASWTRDRQSVTPKSSKSFNGNHVNRPIASKLPDSLQTFEPHMLESRPGQVTSGRIAIVDTIEIDYIVRALFNPSRKIKTLFLQASYERNDTLSEAHPISTPALGLNFQHATTVPYRSFLWNLLEYLFESASPTPNFQHFSSLIGSLKILWVEVVKHIREHWERRDSIPNINIHNLVDHNPSKDNSIDLISTNENGENRGQMTVGIDSRFNIVHQKLCMINCCIARLQKLQKENPKLSSSPLSSKNGVPSNGSLASSFASFTKLNKNGVAENKTKYSEANNGECHDCGFNIDALEPVVVVDPTGSNDVRALPNSETLEILDKPCNRKSPSNLSLLNGEEFYVTSPLGIPCNNESTHKSGSQHRRTPSHNRPSSPTTSLSSDQSDQDIFHPSSLTESFIQLNYSSSTESSSGFEFPDGPTRTDTSKNYYGKGEPKEDDDCSEVNDENIREGHLSVYKNLTLLKTGEPLWVPTTQDNGFLTEDMTRKQEELFEKLGSSEEATKKRAQLQSAHLKSDMEAFKAANPHAIFEDFVRWHSPRDWIPDENSNPNKGSLSTRMMGENNYWKELWKVARRIPASRQKSLFNYAREGEEALKYLEELTIQDLFAQLVPTIFLLAYNTLVSHPVAKDVEITSSGLSSLAQKLAELPWSDPRTENMPYDEIIEIFRQNELLLGKAISLLRKLPKQFELVERILQNSETKINNEAERDKVYELFASGASLNSSFPHPKTREFVLQTPDTSITPGRMYVHVSENIMRLVNMGKNENFV